MKLILYIWLHILRSNKPVQLFPFAWSGKHWFPEDSNYVINSDFHDHNDGNSDNNGNYVDYNDKNNVSFKVILIKMVATVMIMKTARINIIMVMTILIMMMVRH